MPQKQPPAKMAVFGPAVSAAWRIASGAMTVSSATATWRGVSAVAGEGCGGATEKELTTICYCGYVPGKGVVYVTTNCAGYPGTHVCCAAACSTGEDGGAGQG